MCLRREKRRSQISTTYDLDCFENVPDSSLNHILDPAKPGETPEQQDQTTLAGNGMLALSFGTEAIQK